MKIVAITACPTGIAHTYMAAARLEKIAKYFGHDINVETQGAMGIENKVTECDIRQAQCAMCAVESPAERLFDELALPLADDVARMARGAAVDGGAPGLLCDVRRHALLSQVGDERARVVGLVCAQRELVGCARSVAVDHFQRGRALS